MFHCASMTREITSRASRSVGASRRRISVCAPSARSARTKHFVYVLEMLLGVMKGLIHRAHVICDLKEDLLEELDLLRTKDDRECALVPSKVAPTKKGLLLKLKCTKEYMQDKNSQHPQTCLLYTSPSPRDRQKSRMPSSA